MGGPNAGNNQFFLVMNPQTNEQIHSAVISGSINAYVLVYNSTQSSSIIYFDADWSSAGGRNQIGKFINTNQIDLLGMNIDNFVAWI
jgi:hypothetical protein